jgi:hypothetical protein
VESVGFWLTAKPFEFIVIGSAVASSAALCRCLGTNIKSLGELDFRSYDGGSQMLWLRLPLRRGRAGANGADKSFWGSKLRLVPSIHSSLSTAETAAIIGELVWTLL